MWLINEDWQGRAFAILVIFHYSNYYLFDAAWSIWWNEWFISFSYLFILRVIGQRKERRESLSTLTRTITSWHKATHKAIQLAIVKGAFFHPLPILNIWCCVYYTKLCDIGIFWDWRWADRRECPRLRKVIFKVSRNCKYW